MKSGAAWMNERRHALTVTRQPCNVLQPQTVTYMSMIANTGGNVDRHLAKREQNNAAVIKIELMLNDNKR